MAGRLFRRGLLFVAVLTGIAAVIVLSYIGRVVLATRSAVASVDGARTGIPVNRPATIARDARGVPHVRAASVHDLLVAEGYAMGSDRLFQMDTTRRFVQGRLAELLGGAVVRVDRRMRRYAIGRLAAQVYAQSPAEERALLDAFAAGVNAAASREPTPPEYAALFARFEPWKPEDSLAVGFATVLDLDDRPDDVVVRDRVRRALGPVGTDALYPLTDPKYDVPTNGRPPGPIAKLPHLPHVTLSLSKGLTSSGTSQPRLQSAPADMGKPPIGSNGWVIGADRTREGKAILANDPHLDIAIPGIWYLFEGSAPGMHVAGGALAGTPGVTLGHNEHLAWGVTAGETAAMRVIYQRARGTDEFYERGKWVRARHRHEPIVVRFGAAVDADILETGHGVVIARSSDGHGAYVMDWRMQRHPVSPLSPFLQLLRARSAADGIAAMRALPEPALNVIFADDAGRVAYHFAGGVPMESSWGRWAADETAPEPAYLRYDQSPHVDPSRSAIVVTSNNRPDGNGPARLAPFWPPPYRAFEVKHMLHSATHNGAKLSVDDVAAAQRDTTSPAEREFASLVLNLAAQYVDDPTVRPAIVTLTSFDGSMSPQSRGATAVVALRRAMLSMLAETHLPAELAREYPPTSPGFEIVLRALRERPRGWVAHDDYKLFVLRGLRAVTASFNGKIPTFGEYAAQPLLHPLAPFGFKAWNGPTLPGRGGSFAPAVQWNGHAQSFRAIWIAGDWDHGTIDIAAGESGEPGSPHYHDQTEAWTHFARTPLPFSDAAVRAATKLTLTLQPQLVIQAADDTAATRARTPR